MVEIDDVAERDERPDETREIEIEFRELPDRDATADRQQAAVPENQDEAQPDQELHERAHHRVYADESEIALGVFAVEIFEDRDLRFLLRVGAHHADAREVLLRACGNLREEILYLLETRVHLLPEEFHRQRDERHRHEEQERQAHADAQHQGQDQHDDEDGLQRVHDHRPGELAHGGQIVRRASHQVARAVGLKEGERQLLQVAVKVLPQVELDVARHADEDAPLQKEERTADETDAENGQRVARQFRPRHVCAQTVHGAPDEHGDEQPDHHRSHDADDSRDEFFFVRAKIEGEFF